MGSPTSCISWALQEIDEAATPVLAVAHTLAPSLPMHSLMKRLLTLIAVVAVLAVSCGRRADVHWKDGDFKVYATQADFNATKLGYDHHPGLLGLVDSEVVAAGSTAEVVFVERSDPATRRTGFYIIPKEASAGSHSGTVEGPYSEAQFREIRIARRLPEFAWRKSRKRNG